MRLAETIFFMGRTKKKFKAQATEFQKQDEK